jgi:hypothetical protein
MKAMLNGGPGGGHVVDVEEPPPRRYIWEESADLEEISEGQSYPGQELERHRYDLSNYDSDPSHSPPRASYSYGGHLPDA